MGGHPYRCATDVFSDLQVVQAMFVPLGWCSGCRKMSKAKEIPKMFWKPLNTQGRLRLLRDSWKNQLLQCFFENLIPHAVDEGVHCWR